MDITVPISACWPLLNATGETDSVFWTQAELLGYADEEIAWLARRLGGFVETATVGSVAGQATYSLPTGHLSTIEAVWGDVSLKAAGVDEFFAGDKHWSTRQGDYLSHFAQDLSGSGSFTVYPIPTAAAVSGGSFALVYAQRPAEGSTTLQCPEVLRELFKFVALAGARRKESGGAMPDVADWCEGVAEWMRGTVAEVWL